MAEFCLDCFNEINQENKTINEVVTQWDFCERCGKNTDCVIGIVNKDD